MALKFNSNERGKIPVLTLNEFRFIRQNIVTIINKVTYILKTDANTTVLYDYLNSILPTVYEKVYFSYCYFSITDLRVDKYDKEKLDDSLFYCKKLCEIVGSANVYNKYMSHYPGIMYTKLNGIGYTFFDVKLDGVILDFFRFVVQFNNYTDFRRNESLFLKQVNRLGSDYEPLYFSITNDHKRLFAIQPIERY